MKKLLFLFSIMMSFIIYPDFQIRELNYQDSLEIKKVSNLFKDSDISKMTGGWTKESILSLLSNYTSKDQETYGNFFIAINNFNDISGILVCTFDTESKFAEFKILGVHKDYRGCGIASQLIRYAQDRCFKQNLQEIRVGVFPQNNAAIQCYAKHGFSVSTIEKIKAYYEILYAKLQSEPTDQIGFYMRKNINI